MLKIEIALGAMVFALWVFSLIDVISSRDDEVRNLSKLWWLLLVLFFPFVGSLAWLVAGRPHTRVVHRPHERPAPAFPEYDRPGRAAALSPESDEEFLRRCRERAEEQRRRYDAQRKRPEGDPDPADS